MEALRYTEQEIASMDPTEVIPVDTLSTKDFMGKLTDVEKFMSQMPDAKFGDDACPLKHTFGDGLYIREITMAKGLYILSKIHKTTHPYFVTKGECSVITESGTVRIKAPYSGITKAGTQRLLYMHKETVWTTVHATEETDLDKIESEVIAESYEDLPKQVREKGAQYGLGRHSNNGGYGVDGLRREQESEQCEAGPERSSSVNAVAPAAIPAGTVDESHAEPASECEPAAVWPDIL